MPALSICINTQTPLVQFLGTNPGTSAPGSPRADLDLAALTEGRDYRYSPGGVTRMVYPLVRRLIHEGVLREAHWVALNPHAPPTVRLNDLTLHTVSIAGDRMAGYGTVRTYAKLLGQDQMASLLQQTLDEEAEADSKLSEIANTVNVEAKAA